MENTELSKKEMVFTIDIKKNLLETAQWSKFIAIISYIGMVMMLFFGLLFLIGNSLLGSYFKTIPVFVMGLIYIIMAIVYFFPTTYLYRFSKKIKQGVLADDEVVLSDGFKNMKKLSRFTGILIIAMLSIYALVLLLAVPSILIARFA